MEKKTGWGGIDPGFGNDPGFSGTIQDFRERSRIFGNDPGFSGTIRVALGEELRENFWRNFLRGKLKFVLSPLARQDSCS
jgi:hypothetical protein